MKKISYTLFAILLAISVHAQSPNSFKFQAILRDLAGNLITNNVVALQIDLIQGSTNGLVVYSENHYPTTNQFGLVNLQIGNGTPIYGSLAQINWANGPYYIKISVNGAVLGISQLFSVPYANYAEKSGNGFGGNYNDLTNKPSHFDGTWTSISGKPNFSVVSSSGSYINLIDKPIYKDTWASINGKPNYLTFAISGSYTDLTVKPEIFSGSYSDLANKPILFDGVWNSLSGKPIFTPVALSGDYLSLTNLPSLFSGKYTDLLNKPVLFSGNYTGLTNKPVIPSSSWDLLPGKPTFSIVAFSGSYTDLINKPVLFSGNYVDLINKPVLFDKTWVSLNGKPEFSAVANTGSYTDLLNKPSLFNGDYTNLTNRPALFDGTWNSLSGKEALAAVTLSGSYSDLLNSPALFSGSYIDLSNKPTLFTGNYIDLTNKPTILNWTWTLITGKPAFSTVATSGSYPDLLNRPTLFSGIYDDLNNKPTIINWTWALITGKPTFSTVSTSGSYTDLSNQPVNLFSGNYADLTNKPVLFDGTWNSVSGKPGFSGVATSGDYLFLNNLPSLFSGNYIDLLNKPVLFSGNYTDLTNQPVLFDGTWNSVFGKPFFSTLATTGSYTDLLNSPAVFSGNFSDLTNIPFLFDGTWNSLTGKPTYSAVAVSGSYSDLTGKPALFDGKWNSLTATPTTLSGYSITDAMSSSQPANGITGPQITNWNTTASWGNYALAGYAMPTNYYLKTNMITSGGAQMHWNNITNKPTSLSGYGITDFLISSSSNNQLLRFNSTSGKWENWSPVFGNQQLSISGTILTIAGSPGNTVDFTNWDTDNTDDFTTFGNQSISGNKTFTGVLTTSATINANNGLNAGNKKITNVATPVSSQDLATKAYVDNLESQYSTLLAEYNNILAHVVFDYDGNVYKTVTIGTQTWMQQSLKTLHYQNGVAIPTTTNDITGASNPEYQFSPDNDAANIPDYGRLYTYAVTINPANVCPIGWHVPSRPEWETLITFLGGADLNAAYDVIGGILKETGTSHWQAPNLASNSSGLTFLPNGNRHPDGFFAEFSLWGCYQTTTEVDVAPDCNWHFHGFNNSTNAHFAYGFDIGLPTEEHFTKGMAFAIRCVKN